MATTTHNGWKNYETWAVNIHLSNEQSTWEYWLEATREEWNSAEATSYASKRQMAIAALAQRLERELDEAMPDLDATLWADLLRAAFGEVDWHELAANMVEGEIGAE